MIISMTGFGRAEVRKETLAIQVEIKTTNHRYFEASLKLPEGFQVLEAEILSSVRKQIRRGRVEIFICVQLPASQTGEPVVDVALGAKYLKALIKTGKQLGLQGKPDLALLTRLPEIIRFQKKSPQTKSLAPVIRQAIQQALRQLMKMRQAEGRKLFADLKQRLKLLSHLQQTISQKYHIHLQRQEQRVRELIASWFREERADIQPMVLEACLKQVRADVTEELVRLHSHTDQFSRFLRSQEPTGRRLDFILQEINREINTLGAKAPALSQEVVAFKEELEKIREQVQNLE